MLIYLYIDQFLSVLVLFGCRTFPSSRLFFAIAHILLIMSENVHGAIIAFGYNNSNLAKDSEKF